MAKIYIIGAVGSGKTTLAKKISKEINVKYYELDNITWKRNSNGPDIRRSEEEITSIFEKIISKDNWIIENVGKNIYSKAYDKADYIIYINLNKFTLYYRIILRWLNQNIGLESTPYKPTIKMLKQMLLWAKKEKHNPKFNELKNYSNKLIILDNKNLNKFNITKYI